MLALTWDYKFGLRDGSYSISDVQDYFEYIIEIMKLQQTVLPCKFM